MYDEPEKDEDDGKYEVPGVNDEDGLKKMGNSDDEDEEDEDKKDEENEEDEEGKIKDEAGKGNGNNIFRAVTLSFIIILTFFTIFVGRKAHRTQSVPLHPP